jgi:hypothetical protein
MPIELNEFLEGGIRNIVHENISSALLEEVEGQVVTIKHEGGRALHLLYNAFLSHVPAHLLRGIYLLLYNHQPFL